MIASRLGLQGRDAAAGAMAKLISRTIRDREEAGAWHGHGELVQAAAVTLRA